MALILTVVSYKKELPQKMRSWSVDQQGGTLGRCSENRFVLSDPDKYVSRKHAAISYENGVYYLIDTSMAGTYVINKDLHLHHNKVQLADKDSLRIGDYDLSVSISRNNEVKATHHTNAGTEAASVHKPGEDADPKGNKLYMGANNGEDKIYFNTAKNPFGGNAEQKPQKNNLEGAFLVDSFVPPQVASITTQDEIPKDLSIDDLLEDIGETVESLSDLTLPEVKISDDQKKQCDSSEKLKETHLAGAFAAPTPQLHKPIKAEAPDVSSKKGPGSNLSKTSPTSSNKVEGNALKAFVPITIFQVVFDRIRQM